MTILGAEPTPAARRAGLVGGLVVVLVLAALDADLGQERIVTATVVLGPFMAALVCTARQVAVIAAAACAAALLSLTWTDDATSLTHLIRITSVMLGSVVAFVAADNREGGIAARRRLRVLAAVASGAHNESVDESAQRIVRLLVPDVAAAATIDVIRDGRRSRLAARADGLEGGDAEPARRSDAVPARATVAPGDCLVAPMRSRGETIGVLELSSRSRRRDAPDDLEFAQSLADRVALALDNAGLSREVSAAEARFGAALDAMSAAVLIQEPGRGIVYANQAAARAFGLPDADGVVTSTPEEIARAWITTEDDGTPLVRERYPTRRIMTGLELHPEPLIAHNVHVESGRETWMRVSAVPVLDAAGNLVMAVSVSEDITAIKRAEMLKGILARSGEIFAATRDQQESLQDLAELVVPELADWCAISLPADDGAIHQVAVAHRDPQKIAFAREYAERFPTRISDEGGTAAILRGEPPLITEIDDEMLAGAIDDAEQLALLRELGMRAVILVPIVTPAEETLGVLSLVSAESRRTFAEEDLALAAELGRRAGIALETAHLYREQAEAAAVLQRSLMPAELPAIAGFEASALYRPAGTTLVGGDFYDAFRTPRGWALIVGDIAGQGVKAAALTAQARHVLRANTMLSGDLVHAVTHLNRVLCSEASLSLCTICAILLPDDPQEVAEVLCAGHPRPILVRAGVTRELGEWGPMVGAFSDSTFTAGGIALATGDLVVLYTDGLLDARGRDGRFGSERLQRLLAGVAGPFQATDAVRRALADFEQGPQADDTAVVAVHRVG